VADGGRGADSLTGSAFRDELSGGPAGDVLRGGSGNDTLYGEAGNDRLLGGPGRDFLDGDSGGDRLTGGSGKDTSLGFTGRDFLDTADGVRETADCGIHTDRARVDLRDRIQFCERVTRIRGLGPAGS
jgi:Ca2+-binding RTX toxin-like protein